MRRTFEHPLRTAVVTLIVLLVLAVGGPAAASAVVRQVNQGRFESGTISLWLADRSSDPGVQAARNARYAWAESHRDALLTEGDRACSWIRAQPLVPESQRPLNDQLAARYVRLTPAPSPPLSGWRRQVLVLQAWSDLCRGDLRDHTTPRGED